MTRKLKKETIFILVLIISVIFLLIIKPTTANFFDDLYNKITGAPTTQSLGVSVQTNSLPVIGNVTFDMATPISATENGNTTVLFSFVVVDNDGPNDIVNGSAVANFTRAGETTRHNDTFVYPTDGGCNAVNNIGNASISPLNGKNFSCTIYMVFYDGSGSWNVAVRINDSKNAFAQNTTVTFTYNELTALVIAPTTISFPTVGIGDTNVTARNNLTINNTGNDDISGREASNEYINFTAITLVGETSAATIIPTNNFSVGTAVDLGPTPAYCDVSRSQNTTKLINTTANTTAFAYNPAYNNFSGMINGSFILAQATGNFEVLSICFLDVPDDLTAQNYSTKGSASWSVLIW